jgi:CRISPR-associated protein Cmr1
MMKIRKPEREEAPPVQVDERKRAGEVRQVRRYKLITPLFGGGVRPHEADPITVVRGPEIRGNLRFWWRATRGGQFDGDLQQMRDREEQIWGSAAGAGKPGPSGVIISPEVVERGRPFEPKNRRGHPIRNIGDVRSPYSYVAFPLRDDDSNPKVLEDVTFDLSIRCPAGCREEVGAALWAWETFGGLGGRTRRGFGALQLVSIDGEACRPPQAESVAVWISHGSNHYIVSGRWPEGVPHLTLNDASTFTITRRNRDPIEAWRYLFSRLQRFRQSRRPDRNGNPYGRSKWPEADAVRRLAPKGSRGHKPFHPVKGKKFPRGQLGLPIIFHFKDEEDPSPATLQGENAERLASALILRPLMCDHGAVGLAVRLSSPAAPPGGLVIDSNEISSTPVTAKLTPSEAAKIDPLNGEPDVIRAFLKSL